MTILKGIKHAYMAEAGADGAAGGGAAAGAGGDGAGAAGAGQETAQGAGAGAASSSALGAAAGAAAGTEGTGGESAGFDWIPEKHRVTKDDGSFDLEASSRKVADAHRALEQRFGSGDLPPKDATEYAPEVALEGFNWDEFKTDPEMQGFLKGAHAKGITNAQLSYILGEHYQRMVGVAQGAATLNIEACQQELGKTWATPEAMKAGMSGAFKTFSAFAEKAGVTLQDLEASGAANNPAVIRLLAAIAPELGEDRGVSGTGAGGNEDITELLTNEAYTNPNHKDHKLISEKVRRHYERQYGNEIAL